MHRALIVDLQVDVCDRILILVVDLLLPPLVVVLRLLAVDLSQAFALTLEFDACADHGLRILLPDRVLKRRIVRRRRRQRKHLRDIPHRKSKGRLLGAQLHQPCIGGMRSEHLGDTHDSDILRRTGLLPRGQEIAHGGNHEEHDTPCQNLSAPRLPEFHASPSVTKLPHETATSYKGITDKIRHSIPTLLLRQSEGLSFISDS